MPDRRGRAEPPESSAPRKRLKGEERKERFLDVAAELVLEGGTELVTMERIAERSSVNRALPYRFFANRDEVLVALSRREAARLDAKTLGRLAGASGFAEQVRVLIDTYLDSVESGEFSVGRHLSLASTPGPALARWQRARFAAVVRHLADVLITRNFRLSPQRCHIVATIMLAGAEGCFVLLEQGISREAVVRDFVLMCSSAVDRVVADEDSASRA